METYINGKPLEGHDGFYIVPSNPRFAVNIEGKFFDIEKNEPVKFNLTNSIINNKTYYKLKGGLGAHRAVAEVFCPVPEEIRNEVLLVNHINGIKTDNRASNLEWVTYSGNNLHAYMTGLREDNVTLLCKDYETGAINEFYSMQDCARYIGRNASALYDYLKSPNKHYRLLSNRYAIIRKGERWPEVDPIMFNATGCQKDWVVVDTITKTVMIFGGINSSAEFMGLKASGVAKRFRDHPEIKVQYFCDGRYMMTPYNNFLLDLKDQTKDYHQEDKRKEEMETRANNRYKVVRPPVPILVTDLESGEIKEYPSSEVFCNEVLGGVKKNSFQKHVYSNNGIYKARYKIEYLKNK